MNRIVSSLGGGLAAAVLAAGLSGAASANDEALVKYRQAVMAGTGGHMGAIVQIVKNGVGTPGDLIKHARSLNDNSTMVVAAFATQTTAYDKTRAKPEIWSDRAGFEKAANGLESASGDFLAAITAGDKEAAGKALEAVGEACKGCHQDYRTKK